METTILGLMEEKMENAILGFWGIGFRELGISIESEQIWELHE